MNKTEVKNKILDLCDKYDIDPPLVWSHDNVKDVAKKINDRHDSELWQQELSKLNNDDNLWK